MNIFVITKSLLKRAFKNKYSLIIYILMPIVAVIIPLTVYSSIDNNKFKIAIVDNDNNFISDYLIQYLNDELNDEVYVLKEEEAKDRLVNGECNLVIFISMDFSNILMDNNKSNIEFVYMLESEEIFKLQEIVNSYIENIQGILSITGGNEFKFKDIYNEVYGSNNITSNIINENYTNNLSNECIGFIILFMMIITNSSLSTIIQDRNHNVHKRLLYSNVTSVEYIGGHILWSFILSIVQVVIIIFIFNIMKINIEVTNIELLIIMFTIWLVSIAFGIFSISFCKNEEQLSIINTIIVFPTCMIAGCLWPIDIMNKNIQRLSLILPQRHIIILMEQIEKNNNIYIIMVNLLLIILSSLFLLTIGVIRIENNDFKVGI